MEDIIIDIHQGNLKKIIENTVIKVILIVAVALMKGNVIAVQRILESLKPADVEKPSKPSSVKIMF